MKKYINIAFVYAIAAIACGVFYREFTKFNGFTGKTTLAFTHLHLFVLGTFLFLILAIFSQITNVIEQKAFTWFLKLYNVGLPFMVIMFFVRGIPQVLGIELSKGASSAISGIAGIAHIIMTISIVLLFMALRKVKVFQNKHNTEIFPASTEHESKTKMLLKRKKAVDFSAAFLAVYFVLALFN